MISDLEAFCSLDWGFNAPGCCLWWLCLLDGHLHIAQEYKFQRLTVAEVGLEILKRTKTLGVSRLRYVVADPACWQHTGSGKGEAIAETLARRPIGLPMKKGDNDRKNGWQRVHELFQAAPDGRPWLTIDERCTYLRRTIPAAVSDKSDPDDVDTTIDDHGLDSLRYGAMSRPSPTRKLLESQLQPKMAGWLFKQAREAVIGVGL
jgi:hypothetical protein